MLLLVPLLIAMVVALLRGGSLRHLATLRPQWGCIMASFAIQVVLYVPAVRASSILSHWGGVIYVGALGLALLGAARNWRFRAARIAMLGLALNTVVIVANGGYMPVNAAAMRLAQGPLTAHGIAAHHLYSNTHFANASTRLEILSDVLPIWAPGGHGNVYSAGDVALSIGVMALAYGATRRPASEPANR